MGLSHSPRIVTDGLVLCLDAANKRSYPGAGTTWTDLTANKKTGTLTNMDGSNFSNDGAGSLTFDGTDEYVDLGSQVANLSTLTISFWINYNTFPSNNSPIGYDTNPYDYVVLFQNGNMYFRAGGSYVGHTHNTVNTGVWYNFVVTKGSTYIRMYQNNKLLGQSGTVATNINVEWIGRGYVYDDAKISLVHVYNRELSANEVQQNYLATKGRFQ